MPAARLLCTLPLAPFWKTQRKLAVAQADELGIEPNELLAVSGVTFEPGGKHALVTFALTREVLRVELGPEPHFTLQPLDVESPLGEGFLGTSWVRARPTATSDMVVVEDAHLGGGGMDECSAVGLVNLSTRECVLRLNDSEFGDGMVAFALSPNRRWLAASFLHSKPSQIELRVYDATSGAMVRSHRLEEELYRGQLAIAVDDAASTMAFADERSVRLIELASGKTTLYIEQKQVRALALTGSTLVVDAVAATQLYDRQSGARRGSLESLSAMSLVAVHDEEAAFFQRIRGGYTLARVALESANVELKTYKAALGPASKEGADWLVAHDLQSGRTASVSRKSLLVFEPTD